MTAGVAAAISAVEYYLPQNVLSSLQRSSEFPEWSVEKIDAKTGIRQRHIAAENECSDYFYCRPRRSAAAHSWLGLFQALSKPQTDDKTRTTQVVLGRTLWSCLGSIFRPDSLPPLIPSLRRRNMNHGYCMEDPRQESWFDANTLKRWRVIRSY